MSGYNSPQDIAQQFGALATRVAALERKSGVLTPYDTAHRPSASTVTVGALIFVTDAGSSGQVQVSNGTTWLALN